MFSLSRGSPGIPGGNLVCVAVVLSSLKIPEEAITLVMGIYPLVGMVQSMAKVTGDAIVISIVAHFEKGKAL